MQRGEIWIGSIRGEYSAKPRPFMIVQNGKHFDTDSIVVCPISSQISENKLFRLLLQPLPINGLVQPSQLRVDLISAFPKKDFSTKIGKLTAAEIGMVDQILIDFLGINCE